MDVGGWLRRLGLEQYEAAFRENEIDGAVLPSLTAEDLKGSNGCDVWGRVLFQRVARNSRSTSRNSRKVQ
ncbi:SAM domain-containing protein [Bradyrhizobium erythrophlei]|uniref:SAM domain-containing protein n=1 Tax=Bradyrhizobium erythrophlei TaxID=1437360 RepID=UPI0009A6CEE9